MQGVVKSFRRPARWRCKTARAWTCHFRKPNRCCGGATNFTFFHKTLMPTLKRSKHWPSHLKASAPSLAWKQSIRQNTNVAAVLIRCWPKSQGWDIYLETKANSRAKFFSTATHWVTCHALPSPKPSESLGQCLVILLANILPSINNRWSCPLAMTKRSSNFLPNHFAFLTPSLTRCINWALKRSASSNAFPEPIWRCDLEM